MIALTRSVPRSITRCELTHVERAPIDWSRADRQHAAYEQVLRGLGCTVQKLPTLEQHPDSVFVEDTALVFDECAVITRPGAESRRGEIESVVDVLRDHRPLRFIEAPGTLDGGDVLCIGTDVYVGLSTRSTEDAAQQLALALAPFGYAVSTVTVRDALHLKSLASALPDGRILIDSARVDAGVFDADAIEICGNERAGANVLVIGDTVVCPGAAPRTRDRLEREGYRTAVVDASELAKAEGALTCCSLLLRD
ncbi:MAG TPA: hypothetical protein VJ867_16430 [Gemmatimonadaceae bacterium]|nr:hypothetical protein [Gemmatimonadaceae bacterium]